MTKRVSMLWLTPIYLDGSKVSAFSQSIDRARGLLPLEERFPSRDKLCENKLSIILYAPLTNRLSWLIIGLWSGWAEAGLLCRRKTCRHLASVAVGGDQTSGAGSSRLDVAASWDQTSPPGWSFVRRNRTGRTLRVAPVSNQEAEPQLRQRLTQLPAV